MTGSGKAGTHLYGGEIYLSQTLKYMNELFKWYLNCETTTLLAC